jgi:hypothetical protein
MATLKFVGDVWFTGTLRIDSTSTLNDDVFIGNGKHIFLGDSVTTPTVNNGCLHQRRNGVTNPLRLGTYNNTPSSQSWLAFDRSMGTIAAPLSILNGTVFGSVVGVGTYNGGEPTGHGPEIRLLTTEDWSSTALGNAIDFYTTANATTVQLLTLRLSQGGVTIPVQLTAAGITGTTAAFTGLVSSVAGAAFSGGTNPVSGTSVEIRHAGSGGSGALLSYDRTGAAYKPMTYSASLHTFAQGNLDISTGFLSMAGTQVLTSRRTGWAAATGTATRSTFVTGSVTLSVLAEHVKALIDDFIAHGAIGT